MINLLFLIANFWRNLAEEEVSPAGLRGWEKNIIRDHPNDHDQGEGAPNMIRIRCRVSTARVTKTTAQAGADDKCITSVMERSGAKFRPRRFPTRSTSAIGTILRRLFPGDNAIAAGLLGVVQRLIGAFKDGHEIRIGRIYFANADTDGH